MIPLDAWDPVTNPLTGVTLEVDMLPPGGRVRIDFPSGTVSVIRPHGVVCLSVTPPPSTFPAQETR